MDILLMTTIIARRMLFHRILIDRELEQPHDLSEIDPSVSATLSQ